MTGNTAPSSFKSWVRIQLTSPVDPDNPGAPRAEGELLLRADRVSVDTGVLTFVCNDAVVFKLDRRYVKAIAWFTKRLTFAEWLRERRFETPNQHRRWDAAEDARLRNEVEACTGWKQIAGLHGRSEAAVMRRALHLARTAGDPAAATWSRS